MAPATKEAGARVVMYRAKEPCSGQEDVLDEKGKEQWHLDGATSYEDPETGEVKKVTKDTPRAKKLTEPWVVNPDQLFAADHWLVEKYPHLFIETDPTRPATEVR